MADDPVVIEFKTRNAARTGREVKGVAGALGDVRRSATKVAPALTAAGRGIRNLRDEMRLGSTASYAFRRGVYVAGVSVAGLGAIGLKMGLQFNAGQEQSRVAFEQLIGSAAGARREMAWLTKTAASTPFELPQITQGARRLLAFNFGLKQTNSWLSTIGDVAAGSGLGAESIDRVVTAIGQIRSKGRLQGDELLQLSELGVLDSTRLAKDLGLSTTQLFSGNSNVEAPKALRALKKQFDDTFGGQSAKQARTFNGQMSTLHDNLSQTMGKATWPLFVQLRDHVLPDLNTAAGDIGHIFDRKDIKFGQKLRLSGRVLDRELGPLRRSIEHQIGEAHVPEKLGEEFGKAIPFVAAHMAEAAPDAASAFVKAWAKSGAWAQFLTVGFLAHKMGAFGALGKIAMGKMLGGGKGGIAEALTGRGSPTNPLYVVTLDHPMPGGPGAPGRPGGKRGGKLGRFGQITKIGAGLLGGAAIGATLSDTTDNPMPPEFRDALNRARGGNTTASRRARAIEDARRRGNLSISDTAGLPVINLHAILKVGERELGNVVVRDAARAHARRGG